MQQDARTRAIQSKAICNDSRKPASIQRHFEALRKNLVQETRPDSPKSRENPQSNRLQTWDNSSPNMREPKASPHQVGQSKRRRACQKRDVQVQRSKCQKRDAIINSGPGGRIQKKRDSRWQSQRRRASQRRDAIAQSG
jgi:hypothetical protein